MVSEERVYRSLWWDDGDVLWSFFVVRCRWLVLLREMEMELETVFCRGC